MNDGRLEKNIKALLKVKGLTQEDLAKRLSEEMDVSLEAHHLNQWINKRCIPEKYIPVIANILELPVNALKNEEINVDYVIEGIDDDKLTKKMLEIYFPYESPKSLNNISFKKAYKIHTTINKFIIPDSSDGFKKEIDECYKLYENAYHEGIKEALVNMISISSIYKYIIKTYNFDNDLNNKEEDMLLSYSNQTERKQKELLRKITINNDLEKIDSIKNILSTSTDEIIDLLKELKKYSEYRDLMDYYLAILLAFNLVDISYDEADNALFGTMYLMILAYFDNHYALDFVDFSENMSGFNNNLAF